MSDGEAGDGIELEFDLIDEPKVNASTYQTFAESKLCYICFRNKTHKALMIGHGSFMPICSNCSLSSEREPRIGS